MFGRNKGKGKVKYAYDPGVKVPAVKTSICTGEQVAGFWILSARRFQDVTLIRTGKELESFCRACGITKEELKRIV